MNSINNGGRRTVVSSSSTYRRRCLLFALFTASNQFISSSCFCSSGVNYVASASNKKERRTFSSSSLSFHHYKKKQHFSFFPVSSKSSGSTSTSRAHSTLTCLSLSGGDDGNIDGSMREVDETINRSSNDISIDRKGRTGWNHNAPSESSDFWNVGETSDDTQKEIILSDDSTVTEQRTGWLHNTESVASIEKKKEQEQKKKQQQQQSKDNNDNPPVAVPARRLLQLAMIQSEQNHRIVSSPAYHPCNTNDGRIVVVTEHMISVPVHRNQSGAAKNEKNNDKIDLYFSVAEIMNQNDKRKNDFFSTLMNCNNPKHRAQQYVQYTSLTKADDMALYLQGGPGFGSPSPISNIDLTSNGSWAGKALETGYEKIIFMDQRGTGKSSPITKQMLQKKFPDLFLLDNTEKEAAKDAENNDNENDREHGSKSIIPILKPIDDYHDSVHHPKETIIKVKQAVDDVTNYLIQFRADNIVRDAEAILDALLLTREEDDKEPRPWGCALGQSYGGFCMLTYISQISNPPKICLVTGGLPPMLTSVYDVYSSLWDRVYERNIQYYDMYPSDINIVKIIVTKMLSEPHKIILPSGGTLTARRFLQIGLNYLGSSSTTSSFASLHELLSNALMLHDNNGISSPLQQIITGGTTNKPITDEMIQSLDFKRSFLKTIDNIQVFDDHPIYFWLHESVYADGNSGDGSSNSNDDANNNCVPTNWAAHRAYEGKCTEFGDIFDYKLTSKNIISSSAADTTTTTNQQQQNQPTLFFGEMMFPWMADDYEELNGIGLNHVAHNIATKNDWKPLYDTNHIIDALDKNQKTKMAAAVYYDDLHVDFDASMKLIKSSSPAAPAPLKKCKVWVNNEYQHSGLRENGASIFTKLHGMATGSIKIPS